MDAAMKNYETVDANQGNVREMVLESYHDMLEGKGRDYREFFEEIEGRYIGAGI